MCAVFGVALPALFLFAIGRVVYPLSPRGFKKRFRIIQCPKAIWNSPAGDYSDGWHIQQRVWGVWMTPDWAAMCHNDGTWRGCFEPYYFRERAEAILKIREFSDPLQLNWCIVN